MDHKYPADMIGPLHAVAPTENDAVTDGAEAGHAAPSPFRLDAERIDGPVATVLLAFGLDRAAVPEVNLPACVSAAAGALHVDNIQGTMAFENRDLLLTIPSRLDRRVEAVWNEPGTFQLEDASTISARLTNYSSSSVSLHVDQPARAATTFTVGTWTWASSRSAAAWVGSLPRLKFGQHNLGMWDRSQDRWRSDGLRLKGHYTWYIIGNGRKGDPLLVVDAGSRAPDIKLLGADFSALEFALGCPTRLDLLVGVDGALQPVGAIGPAFGFRERNGDETWPPIPDRFDRPPWAAALFPRVAARLVDPTDRLFVAVSGYMDSLVDHLDGAYLKAQVALEAYSKSLGPVSRGRVNSQPDWVAWVASVEPAIRSLAINGDAAEALLGAVRSAMHGPTTGIVAGALEMLGMQVPKDVLDEVRRRSVPVHEFVMSRKNEDPIHESLPRLRMVQSLLGAAAAKSIGYLGPVLGWNQDASGQREELTWWNSADDPDVSKFYAVERGGPAR